MPSVPATRRGHEYSEAEIDRALLCLALNGGNSLRAHAMLKHDTTLQRTPSSSRLRTWRSGQYAARYQEIRADQAPAIEKAAMGDYREIVVEGAQAVLHATRQAASGIDDLEPQDAAKVAKDLSISTGVAADKLLVFEGRPNIIQGHTDPANTLLSLVNALGIPPTFNGTAVDVTRTPEIALKAETDSANAREDSSPAAQD